MMDRKHAIQQIGGDGDDESSPEVWNLESDIFSRLFLRFFFFGRIRRGWTSPTFLISWLLRSQENKKRRKKKKKKKSVSMPHLRRVATTRVQRLQQSLLSSILLLLVTPSPCACADVSCVETTSRCSGPWRWFHRKIRFIVSFSPFPADWAEKKIKKRRKTGAGQQATKKNRKKGWRQIASNEIPLFFSIFCY